jgi:hypothetical protein
MGRHSRALRTDRMVPMPSTAAITSVVATSGYRASEGGTLARRVVLAGFIVPGRRARFGALRRGPGFEPMTFRL